MKTSQKIITSALVLCQFSWLDIPVAQAAPPGQLTLAQSPLFYGTQQKPIVMLNLTKDNQLHFKAYTDYSDLDDDGKPELTYKHSFNYYGYWDPQKCYEYQTANSGSFVPISFSSDKFCDGTKWSGNFLNWVATSRMDSVRKILYGGKRSTDTLTSTVLERSFLPMDAHSWAKFYDAKDLKDKNGSPKSLQDLVPSSLIGTLASFATASGTTYTTNNGTTVATTAIDAAGDYFITPSSTLSARVGDQIELTQVIADVFRYARVTAINGTRLTINVPNATVGVKGTVGDAAKTSSWKLANLSVSGLTFCNTTFVASGNSTTANAAPLIRVARGNTELWAANERWQCGFQGGEKAANSGGAFAAQGQNGNYFPLSGLRSNAESPPNNITYKVADYTARIQACVDQSSAATDPQAVWAKREGCKAYGTQWKPVGLLQKQDGFKFGLFTGSYRKNISGGVLRSNVGDFSLEVDVNGIFVSPDAIAAPALFAKGSIVKTIDAIRMTGYNYGDGTYFGAVSGDNCDFQLTDLVLTGATSNKRNQGSCTSWGNPIAEMYTESLRYLAGIKTPDTNFDYASVESGSVDAALGLKIITWQDPINNNNYCVPLKNIIFNAATTSYDGDQVNMAGLAGAASAASYTDIIGDATRENIKSGIAGKINGATGGVGFNSCTNKDGTLSTLRGICPEGAPYSGSYLMAGSAYYARNNPIRTTPAVDAALFPDAYTVETFGVSLANNTPKIDILSVDGKSILATITPAYRLDKGGADIGGGTIVDFKIIEAPDFTQPIVKGVYYVNWEDSGFGGDFDQDVIGRIEFSFNRAANTLTVTTAATNASTVNPQGFGYVLAGTNIDGPHFHSGIIGFTYKNPVSNVDECIAGGATPTGCQAGQSPTTQAYTLSGTAGTTLKEPLYYAAKWGAIRDPKTADITKFDLKGKPNGFGVDGPDGIPDNYFNVSNPAKLVEQLDALFNNIQTGSSSSSAAASTTRASSDTLAFTASFDGATWAGFLKAFTLDDSGSKINFIEQWDAAKILNARTTGRKIFSTNSSTRKGIAFEWSALSTTQQTAIGLQSIQQYIAGDTSNEGTKATNFRVRKQLVSPTNAVEKSVLGDIINSNPAYSSEKPDFSGAFSGLPGYADFFKQFDARQGGTKRKRAVFVGANDGMLHAFVGDSAANGGGEELFGYVPSMIYNNLPLLSQQAFTVSGNHKYFVDGSPFVSDANVGTAATPNWKTILLGGLGAGGAGFFALDVTRPEPEKFSVDNVLWELTAADTNRDFGGVTKSDLGASTTQPRIARTKNNGESWFAIFGNGYNSTTTPTHGQAVLFAARLGKTGAGWTSSDLYRIVLSTDIDNGLSTPTLVDYDRDGFVDFIYAGDLQGNLWRIDARNADPAAWTSKKLFDAKTTATPARAQPITTAPQVTRHPNGGLIIMFGTGKYLETSDVSTTPTPLVQSLYGILDADPTSTTAVATQTLGSLVNVPVTKNTLPTTGNSCQLDKGWYVDLNSSTPLVGERSVFDAALVAGTLFMPTLVPSPDLCLGGGKSYLYSINPFTGCATSPTEDTAGIQSTPRFIAIQPAPVGLNSSTGGGKTIEIDDTGRQTSKLRVILLGNSDGKPISVGSDKGRDLNVSSGRLSWREIVSE
jgi:type IV pilus assembly protein PilY1